MEHYPGHDARQPELPRHDTSFAVGGGKLWRFAAFARRILHGVEALVLTLAGERD